MKYFTAIAFIIIFVLQVNAQSALVVRKKSFSKQYFVGSQIKIKTKSKNVIKGRIENIYYDSLEIGDSTFRFSEIKKVYAKRERFNFASNGMQLIIAGIGLPTIVMINSLVNDDPELLPTRYLIISPTIMFIGGSLIYLGTKRVRLKGVAKMYVI